MKKILLISLVSTFLSAVSLKAETGLSFLEPTKSYQINVIDSKTALRYQAIHIVAHIKDSWYSVKLSPEPTAQIFWINFETGLVVAPGKPLPK